MGDNYYYPYSVRYMFHLFFLGSEDAISLGQWQLGKNHATYDLKRIKWCLEKLLDDQRTEQLRVFTQIEEPPLQLLEEVVVALS